MSFAVEIGKPCEVCHGKDGQYRCPQCGVVYCSAGCYQSHSSRCVSNFGRATILATKRKKLPHERRIQMVRILEKAEDDAIPGDFAAEPWDAWWTSKAIANPPSPDCPAPQASPLLPNHLADILYSYCYTMRLYNVDPACDFLGACDVMLSISSVLTTAVKLESVREAFRNCIENSKRPDIFVEHQWQVEVVRDVELCLQTRNHVYRALSEAAAIAREGRQKKANRKLQFFFAWAQTLTAEMLKILRDSVHEYYTSLTALLVRVLAES